MAERFQKRIIAQFSPTQLREVSATISQIVNDRPEPDQKLDGADIGALIDALEIDEKGKRRLERGWILLTQLTRMGKSPAVSSRVDLFEP